MQQKLKKVLELRKKDYSRRSRGNPVMEKAPGAIPEEGTGEPAASKCNRATTCMRAILLMFISAVIGALKRM